MGSVGEQRKGKVRAHKGGGRVGGEDNEEGERGKSSNKPMYVPSMYVRMYMCTVHTS